MGIKVKFGELIQKEMLNFSKEDLSKILNFTMHVETEGLSNLAGRNKSSDDVPKDDSNWHAKVRYAQTNCLWHYHIGIPYYEKGEHGDKTSKYVIHYTFNNNEIKIVDMSPHPPLELPKEKYLK